MSASAPLALAFGIFLALAELTRNWGHWQWWPFRLVDFVAAGLLVSGGWRALRGRVHSARLVAGAWGFTSAMFYMSFWSHVEHFAEPAEGNLPQGPLTVVIGVLWIITLVGFAGSLLARRTRAGGEADAPGAVG